MAETTVTVHPADEVAAVPETHGMTREIRVRYSMQDPNVMEVDAWGFDHTDVEAGALDDMLATARSQVAEAGDSFEYIESDQPPNVAIETSLGPDVAG